MDQFDIVIVGGGINGAGCAADAALRGLSVLLCEQDDLASKTSSHSSQLIHGGLRYLEYFDFKLVKKALEERQRLLTIAPHIVHPLPFVLPHHPQGRSPWLISIGLYLYDYLSKSQQLPKHQSISRRHMPHYFQPLLETLDQAHLFYDCKTDDARLVIHNTLQAKAHGAVIKTNTALIKAEAQDNLWHLVFQSKDGSQTQVQARALINAAGSAVQQVNMLGNIPTTMNITLIQGSHLIVPRLYQGQHAYLLQDIGKRIIFTIPYHHAYTLIGTTEIPYDPKTDQIQMKPIESEYLCAIVKRYFKKTITPEDCLESTCGVRTLVSHKNKNVTALSRDIAYHFSSQPAPVVSIYSGKITTYRELSEEVINSLRTVFPNMPASATATTPLIGATYDHMNFTEFKNHFNHTYSWLNPTLKMRYLETYGAQAEKILQGATNIKELGQEFGHTLYEAEVNYLIQEEWAQTAEDILWRRTKLGLALDQEKTQKLMKYLH